MFTHQVGQNLLRWYVWLQCIQQTHGVIVHFQLQENFCLCLNLVAFLLPADIEEDLLVDFTVNVELPAVGTSQQSKHVNRYQVS